MKRRVWGPYQNIVKDDLNDIGTFAQEAVEMALAAITPPARLSGLQASAISSNTVKVTAGWMVVSDSTVGRPRLGVLAGDTNLTVSGPAGTYLVVATVFEQDLETRTIAPPPQTLPNGQPNPFYDPTLNPYNQVTLKGWRVSLSLRPGSYTPANREAVVAQVTWDGSAITGVTQVLDWPKPNITDRSIPAIKIADDLAGNGTSRNASGGIQVNVDNSTVEISSNTLRVKDGGITDAKLGNRTISDGTSPSSDTGTLTSLLSGLANRIKAITGGTTWRDAPATTISELNANVARKGNSETITGAWTFTGNITIAKPTTGSNAYIARISFPIPSGRNDSAYIEHRETTADVAELRISISDNDGSSNDRLYIGSAPSGIWKPRVAIDTAGKFYWGDGSGTFDVDLYRGGAGTLSTSGTLTVNGNLGVGTTSPSYKLAVSGDANISQTLIFSKGIVTGGDTTFSEVYNTNTSYQLAGANSNATALHIFSPNNAPVLNLQTNKDTDGASMGGIVWTRQGGQSDAHRQIAGIEVVQSGTGVIAGSTMRFWTKASSFPSVRMVIDGNGNVGIGTASPSYKLDVSGDVRWTGTLQGGTVPWVRLSGYPSVNAGTGLTGGGSLSENVTLNLATDFIKNFPTGTPSAGDFALIGPSNGSTNYKVPIGPGVNRIPFHAGDGRGVELKGAGSVAHLAGEFTTTAGNGRWVRLFQITLDGNYRAARGEIWFGRTHNGNHLSSRLGYYVGTFILPTNEARLALAPGLPVSGESTTGVITDAAIVQTGSNTYELWVQVYTDSYGLSIAWHHRGAVHSHNGISYAFAQSTSLPSPTSGGLFIQWSTASGSSKGFFVSTESIADNAVTNPKVADGAITTSKLADGSVTAVKLASGAAAANMQGTDRQWGALNWDALTAPGWYRITSGGTGGSGTPPPSPVQEGFLAVMRGDGGAVTQMFIPKGGNYLTPFTRQLDAGVWTAWAGRISALTTNTPAGEDYIVADRPNGTAYKLPLIGSGGVIEYGSNSNGSYIRFADGTQVCWQIVDDTDGDFYTWTYPATFASTPVAIGQAGVIPGNEDWRGKMILALAFSATAYFYPYSATGTATVFTGPIRWYFLAIGRWK